MNDEGSQADPLDRLADEFVARYRLGERPALSDYCTQYPELADDIRRVFPTLLVMEQARPVDADFGPAKSGAEESPRLKLERLGDYRILREIARGGMGIVYEAVQESLGRHVALKVLPPQAVLDPRHLQRFQREARAAAKLHHTNIVPVFGVGDHEGIYYYVMQFIHGLGLDQVLDQVRRLRDNSVDRMPIVHRRENSGSSGRSRAQLPEMSASNGRASAAEIAGSLLSREIIVKSVSIEVAATPNGTSTKSESPENSATFHVRPPSDSSGSGLHRVQDTTSLSHSGSQYWQSVARIGIQVAEAIDYAFGQGVLHRDIKPSNLLLDAHGTVWVTDFGLAKATDNDDLTHTGDIVGTLRYLPPERLKGQVDLRGDLYSLGVTLYEMLTLQPPFQDHDRSRLMRRILDDEPTSPREIDGTIPQDLETIVMKAIAKDPPDRYQTPADLAEDLRQFLDDKPIAARSIGQLERMWRWCRRNPRIAFLTGAVATLLVAVSVVSSVSAVLLKRERDLARAAEQAATAAERKATNAEAAGRRELYRAYLSDARATYMNGRREQRLRGLDAIHKIVAAFPPNELTEEKRTELRDEAIKYLAVSDLREVARIADYSFARGSIVLDDQLDFVAVSAEHGSSTIIRRVSDPSFRSELVIAGSDQTQFPTIRAFSPSGRWLAELRHRTGENTEQQLVVWDWREKQIAFREEWAPGRVLAFHPNDRQVVYRRVTGHLALVDILSQKIVSESTRHWRAIQVAFSHDGKSLAIANDVMAEIVDPNTWQTIATLPEAGPTESVDCNPVEPGFAFGLRDSRIYLWNSAKNGGRFLHAEWIGWFYHLCFSPNGRLLAASGGDRYVHIRDLIQDRVLLKAPGEIRRFSRDGERVAAILDDQLVIYEFVPAPALTRVPQHSETADFSPDGNWLITAGHEGVHLYDADSLTLQADLGLDPCGPVGFHPDQRSLLTYGQFSHIQRWPLEKSVEKQTASATWRIGPPQPVTERSDIVSLTNGLPLAPQHFGRQVAFSRNSQVFATMNVRNDGHLLVGDSESAAPPRTFKPFTGIRRVAVSADGQWIAAAGHSPRHTGLFRAADAQPVLELPKHGNVTFSPDGVYFASSSISEVRLYRVGTWHLERTIRVEQPPNFDAAPIAFQPGGHLIAVGDSFYRTRLYDRETGHNVANLTHSLNESAGPYWLSFSPDGTRLAMTRFLFDVLVWDLAVLRKELSEVGLDVISLPERHPSAEMAQGCCIRNVTVQRGTQLPLPEHWFTFWQKLAEHEASLNNWPDAIDDINRGLDQHRLPVGRDRAKLLVLRGTYHLRNGDARGARDDWIEAVSLAPENVEATRSLARMLVLGPTEYQDPGRSLALISALAAAPNPEVQDTLILGATRLRLGQPEPALAALQSISDSAETRTLVQFLIAMAQWKLGRHEDAKKTYEAASASINQAPHADAEVTRLGAETAELLSPAVAGR